MLLVLYLHFSSHIWSPRSFLDILAPRKSIWNVFLVHELRLRSLISFIFKFIRVLPRLRWLLQLFILQVDHLVVFTLYAELLSGLFLFFFALFPFICLLLFTHFVIGIPAAETVEKSIFVFSWLDL